MTIYILLCITSKLAMILSMKENVQVQHNFIKGPSASVNFGIHRGSLGPNSSPWIPKDDCIVVLDNIELTAKHLIMIKLWSSEKISCQHVCAV